MRKHYQNFHHGFASSGAFDAVPAAVEAAEEFPLFRFLAGFFAPRGSAAREASGMSATKTVGDMVIVSGGSPEFKVPWMSWA